MNHGNSTHQRPSLPTLKKYDHSTTRTCPYHTHTKNNMSIICIFLCAQ